MTSARSRHWFHLGRAREFVGLRAGWRDMEGSSFRAWAVEEFGATQLGDVRRTARLVTMASEVAQNPGGRVSSVFRRSAERQGAYDFLESKHVGTEAILAAAVEACNRRSAEFPFVFVPLDGTSLNLTDLARTKNFGSVGSRERGARGLKVIDAIAVAPDGTPLGIAGMKWWARGARPSRPRELRSTAEKELQHWLDAVDAVTASMRRSAPETRAWFQVDREGDAQYLLDKLAACGGLFTVRSQSNRRLSTTGLVLPGAGRHPVKRRRYLRGYMSRQHPVLRDLLEVPGRDGQPARQAVVVVRAASVVLQMQDRRRTKHRTLPINVVWVREYGFGKRTSSRSGKSTTRSLDWMLLTNHSIETVADLRAVIAGYKQRWRIEDFHRAWKRGACNVETSQLRAREHVIKWATVLAAVAVRAERIKHLSRERPHASASAELSPREVQALILLKRRYRKQNEHIGDETPDLQTATRWIAELGGYIGRAAGGPPGTTTIARGLAQLHIAAEMLDAAGLEPRSPPRSD
jgi:hypothetical protein